MKVIIMVGYLARDANRVIERLREMLPEELQGASIQAFIDDAQLLAIAPEIEVPFVLLRDEDEEWATKVKDALQSIEEDLTVQVETIKVFPACNRPQSEEFQ